MPRKSRHDRFVKAVRAKGATYLYFKTGRTDARGREVLTRLPDPSDRYAYGTAYAACLTARSRFENRAVEPHAITVPKLVDLFQKSAEFRKKAKGTQRVYNIQYDKLIALLPTAPAAEVTADDIVRLMDDMAETPGAANLFVGAVGGLYKWARGRHVPRDCRPTFGVELFDMGEHEPWPEELLDAALASENPIVRLATHLLYYTAQRIEDVVSMRWSDIRDGWIRIEQGKTNKVVEFPVHQRLQAVLAETPKSGMTIIASPSGRKRSQGWVRDHLQAFAIRHGGLEIVPHGLRKNAVNALLECGCSVAETAAISGQTLKLVEHYAKKRNARKLGGAAILNWNRAGK